MDETEALIRLSMRALAIQMTGAPGLELRLTEGGVLGLTDEPLADFNRLTLGDSPDASAFLAWSVARARQRGRPLAATFSPRAAATLAPAAMRLGLRPAGSAPLMLLRAETPIQAPRPVRVARALGPEWVRIAGDLAAAAFDTPRDVIARCIDVCITETAGFETYVAWGEAGPMSAVTMTPQGRTAGVSLMATPPEHQRKGMGRALLTQVMADYRRRGVERFYLGATEAGLPLYASLGFETVAELSVWLLDA